MQKGDIVKGIHFLRSVPDGFLRASYGIVVGNGGEAAEEIIVQPLSYKESPVQRFRNGNNDSVLYLPTDTEEYIIKHHCKEQIEASLDGGKCPPINVSLHDTYWGFGDLPRNLKKQFGPIALEIAVNCCLVGDPKDISLQDRNYSRLGMNSAIDSLLLLAGLAGYDAIFNIEFKDTPSIKVKEKEGLKDRYLQRIPKSATLDTTVIANAYILKNSH